ncbi:MAG TPA: hypothetical protein VI670_24310 [Thermoanaerobaculia bacterium]|jgi:hypothetical protein
MSALPFLEIDQLDVRVVTADEDDAGTDNDVWFDIGPVGWKLKKKENQFERGANEVYGLDCSGLHLTTDDIVWLRLQKKGIGGVTGTPEGSGGGWKVDRLELIVNRASNKPADFVLPVKVDRWLEDDHTIWTKQLRPPWSAARRFARTVRLRPNKPLSLGDETIAILTTTHFKLVGVSGWLGTDLHACATGTVLQVGESNDGLATIDLQLALLEIMQQGQPRRRYRFDPGHGINAPRFLRVEYFHVFAGKPVPSKGDCVRICGKVKLDTDHEWWYEIHPRSHEDVQILGKGACAVEALPGHATLSLRAAIASDFPKADLSKGLRALDACLGSAELSVRTLIQSAAF